MKPSWITCTSHSVLIAVLLSGHLFAATEEVKIEFTHGPLRPTAIPVWPGLNAGKSMYGSVGRLTKPGDYEPTEGDSFAKHNGKGAYNYIITAGAWWLRVGDQPRLSMSLRTPGGAYAQPALLPGLGVGGTLRIAASVAGKTKWLDRFASIDTVLSPASARWTCSDPELGITVELTAHQFIETYGFSARAAVKANDAREVTLTWAFGRLSGGTNLVELQADTARLSTSDLKYTQVFVGLARTSARATLGNEDLLQKSNDAPVAEPNPKRPCVLLTETLAVPAGQVAASQFLCVWGYTGYDAQGVAEAYQRLEYRPFADLKWLEEMKKQWFHHWIGKGLEPQPKFQEVRRDPARAVAAPVATWDKIRRQIRIQTPDARFDNVVHSTAAQMRMQYEYPGIIHGLGYCKYGKINCGYYGFECAGYHDEVANSLKFISGTQCVKGRQRYFMPAFSLSAWAEEVDFYFVEQVWYHYRWTGDREFLKTMWPAARRTLEHALAASDPDGDGLMTGYYEMWNCDTYARGGKCALQTGMAWAALRAGAAMAEILNDEDWKLMANSLKQGPRPPNYAQRYAKLAQRSEKEFSQQLWNPSVGAWCSAEWNGDLRPKPANHEQNYHIWRGLGDPKRNYLAMRYVRENLHLDVAPGAPVEFEDIWWPVMWSHHYVASGDTCASVASACTAGDIDHYWPALKYIAESAYSSGDTAVQHNTGSHSQENDTMFLLAVVEGIFGVKPYFGENLLVLRPALPAAWKQAEIALADGGYQFATSDDSITLRVTTPVARKLRAEVPLRRAVKSVSVNGQETRFTLEPGVNGARVIVESPAARDHLVEVKLAAPVPAIGGDTLLVSGKQAVFTVAQAELKQVHDPQGKLRDVMIAPAADGRWQATFTANEPGKWTVFLELASGTVTWYHPLDLEVRPPWTIVRRYLPAFTTNGPSVSSPSLDPQTHNLTLELANHDTAELAEQMTIAVGGHVLSQDLKLPGRTTNSIGISLASVWSQLSPGSVPVRVQVGQRVETADAVNWLVGETNRTDLTPRLRKFDLGPYYNVNLRRLYSPEFQWRIDYTGCAVGIDWRDPMPERDKLGYTIMNAPISQFEYGVVTEQSACNAKWDAPEVKNPFDTPMGISFFTAGGQAEKNVLALASTEPHDQLPSRAVLTLGQPKRLEKLYLLTANLTKTLKCYYPGAEIVVHYAEGEDQVIELVPPYTMSCMIQHFSPYAYAIPFGKVIEGAHPLRDKNAHLAVSDLVLDAKRSVRAIELKCVASETLFAVLGATMLTAQGGE